MNFLKAALISLVVLFSGCTGTPTTPEREILYNIGARQVVFRYIAGGATPAEQRSRSLRIKEVALAFQALVSAEAAAVTLQELRVAAEAEIHRTALSWADKDLLLSLVVGLEAYLKQRTAEGALSPEARATVFQVLGWISDAAAAYPLQQ